MNEEELTRAIIAQAHKTGLGFEAGLPGRILEDLGREPGQLPLLELCLTRLWEHARTASCALSPIRPSAARADVIRAAAYRDRKGCNPGHR